MHFAAEALRTWLPDDDEYLTPLKWREKKNRFSIGISCLSLENWCSSSNLWGSRRRWSSRLVTRSALNSERSRWRSGPSCALCSSCQGRCIDNTLFTKTFLNCTTIVRLYWKVWPHPLHFKHGVGEIRMTDLLYVNYRASNWVKFYLLSCQAQWIEYACI